MAKLSDNAVMGIRAGGTIFGVSMAVLYARGWTQRLLWGVGGVVVGFGIPPAYDYMFDK
jgi:hypothetical protein